MQQSNGISRTEAASIRSKLQLRQRPDKVWEVYTTIHGTNVFRWFLIDQLSYEFYVTNFNPPVIPYESEKHYV